MLADKLEEWALAYEAEGLEKGIQQIMEKGMEKGIEKGEMLSLQNHRTLLQKYLPLPYKTLNAGLTV